MSLRDRNHNDNLDCLLLPTTVFKSLHCNTNKENIIIQINTATQMRHWVTKDILRENAIAISERTDKSK